MTKGCRTCAVADPSTKQCRVFGIPIDLNDGFCSNYVSELWTCDRCGHPMLPTAAVINEEEILCGNCAKSLGTCQTCQKSKVCEFQTNPDPMPKVVLQTVRQGNMVMQTQVMNPDRISKFCPECSCYSLDHGCLKESGACLKWC